MKFFLMVAIHKAMLLEAGGVLYFWHVAGYWEREAEQWQDWAGRAHMQATFVGTGQCVWEVYSTSIQSSP